MPTIEESIVIAAPADKVFGFMADGSNAPVFDSSCIRCEPERRRRPRRSARGGRARPRSWAASSSGPPSTPSSSPTGWSTIKSVESKLPFQIRTELTPEGDGVRVNYRLEADSGLGGVFGRLADPLVVKAQTRTVKANLASLKDLMESDAV